MDKNPILMKTAIYATPTKETFAKKIGKTEKTVYRAIKSLKENGYIVREGTDTSGYWKILK